MSAQSVLIPRRALFGRGKLSKPRLSPDGERFAYLFASESATELRVGDADVPDGAKAIADTDHEGVLTFHWAYDRRTLLYLVRTGEKETQLRMLDFESQAVLELTPRKGVAAELSGMSALRPNEVLVTLRSMESGGATWFVSGQKSEAQARGWPVPNNTGSETGGLPDEALLYRMDIRDGGKTLLHHGTAKESLVVDRNFLPRLVVKEAHDGGLEVHRLSRSRAPELFDRFDAVQASMSRFIGFDASGRVLYSIDSRLADTTTLVATDMTLGTRTALWCDPRADIDDVLISPNDHRVLAVATTYERREWKVLDAGVESRIRALTQIADGEIRGLSCDGAKKRWAVTVGHDRVPKHHYLYQHGGKSMALVGIDGGNSSDGPELHALADVEMRTEVVEARDGASLVCHYSVPDSSEQRWPLVVLARRSPWGHDAWGFNPYHQWLTNRGYAVLSVNVRGTGRFGRAFSVAADGEWADHVVNDFVDAVAWAADAGFADPERVAVVGTNFGGHVALSALAFAAERFACAVSLSPFDDLPTLASSAMSLPARLRRLVVKVTKAGRTACGKIISRRRSPYSATSRIDKPLMLFRSCRDDDQVIARSGRLVGDLRARGVPVFFGLLGDDKSGEDGTSNRRAKLALIENFLAAQLGGMATPIGEDFRDVDVKILAGAELVGLKASYAGTV